MTAATSVPVAQIPLAGAQPTVAGPWGSAIRAFRWWLVNYRRTWKGSIYSSVLSPVLYLGAMGLGLGTLVDKHGTASLGGSSYLAFLAPGLMAAAAMQTAVGESLYPVFSAVKWQQTYSAAAATPLRPGDLFRGHILFTTMRLIMNMFIFLAIMAAFGVVRTPWMV
ncbi:MAG: ABC transporter, partial [Actinobacteria bacterium]|nr:ABC transporter [Actinomycetota bacterium]